MNNPSDITQSPDGERTSQARRNHSKLLIGNGPSAKPLANFGFANLPDTMGTFGMGAAYRYFSRINWWPTFYAWCDVKVVHSHNQELARLIDDPDISTERFFFSLPISTHSRFECVPHSSTGDFCFRKAVELGYTKIYIIGVEGNYVEELAESRPLTKEEFRDQGFEEVFKHYRNTPDGDLGEISFFRENLRVIQSTPQSNPNYFFDDYQRVGDVYTLPRSHTHRNAWRKSVSQNVTSTAIEVFNVSPSSKVRDFTKLAWLEFLREIAPADSASPETSPFRRPIETPTALSPSDRAAARATAGLSPAEPLATLLIGFRSSPNDPTRLRNLRYLLSWVHRYYGDLFDVLLIEQGTEPTLTPSLPDFPPGVRHEFLFNPHAYNRGWGYNAAVRHFTHARVVALLDTDVLPGANFVQEVIDCHRYYKVATPYLNVYFTNDEETSTILTQNTLEGLRRSDGVNKPTTISGGIVIIRRNLFEELVGFEQYVEYAGEDRSLDVTLLNHCEPADIRLAPYTYVHLNHPTGTEARPRWKELFTHLRENYGCRVDTELTLEQNIHLNCHHVSRKKTLINLARRRSSYGDLDLYRSGVPLTINGCYTKPAPNSDSAIFPPAFKGLGTYESNEIYKAPEPDSERLSLLHNAYRGKRCFIIGNGPSLNQHDLSLLEGEYSFAVNSFFYKTDETGYRPTFYVVEDSSVMKENTERIQAYEAPLKFFPTIYKNLHPPGDNVHFFQMNRGFYEKSSPNYCVPRFSTDASKVAYCGQSVTYINLQLAFFMGFTEVYLIGMDFDYVIPAEHKRTGDLILSTTDDPNHFHKDYFGKGKTWKDPKLERVALNYRQAKLSFDAVGRKIYNATIGGKLELFERVDYNTLLGGNSSSTNRRGQIAATQVEPIDSSENAQNAQEFEGEGKTRDLTTLNSTTMQPSMIHAFRRRHGLSILEGTSVTGFCSFLPLAFIFIQSGQLWPWGWAALSAAFIGGASLATILHEIFHRARKTKATIGELQQSHTKLSCEIEDGDTALTDAIEALRKNSAESLATEIQKTTAAIETAVNEAGAKSAALTAEVAATAQERSTALKAELATTLNEAQARSDSVQAELQETRRSLDAAIAKLNQTADSKIAKLRAALGEIRTKSDAWQSELKELRSALEDVSAQSLESEKVTEERLDNTINSVKDEVHNATQEIQQCLSDLSKDIDGKVTSDVAAMQETWEKKNRFSNYGNAPLVRVHNRQLSEIDIRKIDKNWMTQLGLSVTPRQLHYVAHQICLAEERCEGRMATTIQAAVLRTLILLSLQAKKVELLEIGTLFGVASGALYRAALRAESQVHLSIIDPLKGYYDQGLEDEQTGVPVTRKTLVDNLAAMGVPKRQYRIIQELSSSPNALKAASERRYDYALIDGDHSLEGVASDFQLYGPLVKPGGVIIIDDYGNKTWPAIKPYVDEHVRTNDDWLWIGAEWGTAVLRRKRQDTQ